MKNQLSIIKNASILSPFCNLNVHDTQINYAPIDARRCFFHYIIAKSYKEGYVFRVYNFNKEIIDVFQIMYEVMNG